ncbi:hypothetical protein [Mycobacteroides abscessus]|uniref:hypothetical protein n=1 Tax=Mycobacteroides abscessus TaxID=36809 RepID=UPI0009CA0C45|nr:hypothetical protein [Mycobacteroides abscessus]SLH39412.1 Uncharacterised protein [Mycobacteroides abscessus subsp. massiliense]
MSARPGDTAELRRFTAELRAMATLVDAYPNLFAEHVEKFYETEGFTGSNQVCEEHF